MKIILSKSKWIEIGRNLGWVKEAKRLIDETGKPIELKDIHGDPIGQDSRYALKLKNSGKPLFFAGGKWSSPTLTDKLHEISFFKPVELLYCIYPWYKQYDAIPKNRGALVNYHLPSPK